MKLPHALPIYSTVSVKKCYVVAFFQGRAATNRRWSGKFNSITCPWADNFCLLQWKNY